MKRPSLFVFIVGCFAAIVSLSTVSGAILLTASGTGVQTFNSLPAAQDWSTLALSGSAADIKTLDQLHAAVQPLGAASISQQLGSASSVPPTTDAIARWNTTAHYLQSRPSLNRATLLMARLQNACGTNATGLRIAFDLGINDPLAGELPGFQVYYSLSGNPGDWRTIPALSGLNTAGAVSATVPFHHAWTNGTLLYLLWTDDNAENITDPSYTLDNITIGAVVPGPPFQPSIEPAVAIHWPSETNRFYLVQWTSRVPTNQWTALSPFVTGTSGTNIVFDSAHNDGRFYRLTVLK